MNAEDSPSYRSWSPQSTIATDWTLHQVAPYIGRLKPSIARSLIFSLSGPGDLIADPFCGSGVIPLEAVAAGRSIVATDWNPYAVLLTRAKLFPPADLESAISRFELAWNLSRSLLKSQDLRTVPRWVRYFFHPETLRSTLAFREACVRRSEHFLLACLLGILHHQRPGFLSYPSSHLVPYLRSRNFPREIFPTLYEERDVRSRMLRKLSRTFRRFPPNVPSTRIVHQTDARSFPFTPNIAAVITSPPYMNELDYVRDNRLRLWFINRRLPTGIEIRKRNHRIDFEHLISVVFRRMGKMVRVGGHLVIILGDASRCEQEENTAAITRNLFSTLSDLACFVLVDSITDSIPDIRRSRRGCRGTKVETILIFRVIGK
jgi:hypothetical protein